MSTRPVSIEVARRDRTEAGLVAPGQEVPRLLATHRATPDNSGATAGTMLADCRGPADDSASSELRDLSRKSVTSLVPFRCIEERFSEVRSGRPRDKVDLSYEDLRKLIGMLLLCVEVDEAWYCRTYPDVAEALNAGAYTSAREHFVKHGYFEGRRPRELPVDEVWYRTKYPDVAERIENGEWESASDHFNNYGYAEGRLPSFA